MVAEAPTDAILSTLLHAGGHGVPNPSPKSGAPQLGEAGPMAVVQRWRAVPLEDTVTLLHLTCGASVTP
jgi:hypothetical protein